MTYQHLLWPESVAVRAAGRRVGDPPPVSRLHKIAQHSYSL